VTTTAHRLPKGATPHSATLPPPLRVKFKLSLVRYQERSEFS